MLENCCYNGEELWIMQMIKEGVFGTLTHAECAYLHDLRVMMLDPTYYEDRWRLKHHLHRNGNLYTTHGLGPVSMYFDILRGDTLSHLVSMSSKEAALSEALAATDEGALQDMAQRVKCGDVNTTLIGTASGKSIMLQFDTHSGRPYSRLDKVVGSKAAHYGYPSRLYVDHGPSWGHSWLDDAETAEMRDRYAHPLWTKLQALAADHKQGHGGMDFVMMFRLIRCLNQGLPLDMNVYDGALWSLVGHPRRGVRLPRLRPRRHPRPHRRQMAQRRATPRPPRHRLTPFAPRRNSPTSNIHSCPPDFAWREIRHVLPVGLRPPKFQSVNPPSLRSIGIPKTPDREAARGFVVLRLMSGCACQVPGQALPPLGEELHQ